MRWNFKKIICFLIGHKLWVYGTGRFILENNIVGKINSMNLKCKRCKKTF